MDSTQTSKFRDKVRAKANKLNRRLMAARFDLSDVVQDCMLQYSRNPQDQPIMDSAWINKILVGSFCNLQRHNLAQKRSVNREELANVKELVDVSPSSELELKEQTDRMLHYLDQLHSDSKYVLIRRFFHEASIKEIAQEMNTTEYGADTILKDALKTLKSFLNTLPNNPK